jgi:hypothetical protein
MIARARTIRVLLDIEERPARNALEKGNVKSGERFAVQVVEKIGAALDDFRNWLIREAA